MRRTGSLVCGGALIAALMAGCSSSDTDPGSEPSTPAASTPAPEPVPATRYDLGKATIDQDWFDEDSRFRKMPVQLNGVIAAPTSEGPHPVVLILHGTHPGCPEDEGGVDRWPCAPEDEKTNYLGFEYLVSELAGRGYVALAPNINAEYTFGFGEGIPGKRLEQLVDLHLKGLAAASSGGSEDFGVDLAGSADLSQLVLVGHSRGGEQALSMANEADMQAGEAGYGPVAGVLQIAAAATSVDPWTGSSVPLATVQSSCDGDVSSQDGQSFYEGIRLAGSTWAASAWLEGGTHNGFNTELGKDLFPATDRPDCETLLPAEDQREWLVGYSADFLAAVFAGDAQARARMGLDVTTPAPSELYGVEALVSYLPETSERSVLFVPAEEGDLTTTSTDVGVEADGVTTTFCPKAFYTVDMKPDTEPCQRQHVIVPGQPAHAVASWETSGGELRFDLPETLQSPGEAAVLTLRAAVSPASELNEKGSAQAFTVRLTDGSGAEATVTVGTDEPALRFPPGKMKSDEVVPEPYFTGRVPLTTIRVPLEEFSDVDLDDLAEVALVFDQSDSGTLFLADLEFAQAG